MKWHCWGSFTLLISARLVGVVTLRTTHRRRHSRLPTAQWRAYHQHLSFHIRGVLKCCAKGMAVAESLEFQADNKHLLRSPWSLRDEHPWMPVRRRRNGVQGHQSCVWSHRIATPSSKGRFLYDGRGAVESAVTRGWDWQGNAVMWRSHC